MKSEYVTDLSQVSDESAVINVWYRSGKATIHSCRRGRR
jgi:hypothetical protein